MHAGFGFGLQLGEKQSILMNNSSSNNLIYGIKSRLFCANR